LLHKVNVLITRYVLLYRMVLYGSVIVVLYGSAIVVLYGSVIVWCYMAVSS
jgi:hypothetical protein